VSFGVLRLTQYQFDVMYIKRSSTPKTGASRYTAAEAPYRVSAVGYGA